MEIRNTVIEQTAALAPMAGVADRAFRELCVSFGACMTTTEMVSAKALTFGDKKSYELAAITRSEAPVSVQLFGSEPEAFAKAICLLTDRYTAEGSVMPAAFDINMGCPAPKIYKNGAGSTLMKSPELIERIVKACVGASDIPVTVKMRAGFDKDHINAAECAKAAEAGGASAVTVHARTREQMYAPPVYPDIITQVKRSVNIPVIGNGDIRSAEDALKMYRETGCDLVAVGRGALGRPWIFSLIAGAVRDGEVPPGPTVPQRMEIMLRHVGMIIAYKGEYAGILEARKHALWYTKGLRGSAALRQRMSMLSSMEELTAIAEELINQTE